MRTVDCLLATLGCLVALATLAIDWHQTDVIQLSGGTEANPIMGKHPSPATVMAYFMACIGVQSVTAGVLLVFSDPCLSMAWSMGWSLAEAYIIGWNRSRGFGP
jgi:hypothetical protein